MKRSVFFLSFLLVLNSLNIIAVEVEVNTWKPLSLYVSCFILKEWFKAYVHSFFIDEQKIDKACIACCQCNTTATSGCLLGYAVNELDAAMIKKITNLIYYGSIEEITTYLLAMYKKHKIECYMCRKYNDWHIVEQQSSPKN